MPGVFAFPPLPRPMMATTEIHTLTPAEASALCGIRVLNETLSPRDIHPIDSVREHPRNPRQGDVGKLCVLIKTNGWHGRLLVQRATPDGEPRNFVIAGNHRRRAAKENGAHALPMEYVTCTDAEAEKILVADNKASDDASNDPAALLELLHDRAAADDLEGTGYDGDELDELEKLVNGPDESDAETSDPVEPDTQWLCVVTCRSENEMGVLFDDLTTRGYACKLVT